MTMKRRTMDPEWARPNRSKTAEGKQIKCLNALDGYTRMVGLEELSLKVRSRLANSPFNICAVCLINEAGWNATDADYFRCIQVIEGKLRSSD
jgi:hypothetical protein